MSSIKVFVLDDNQDAVERLISLLGKIEGIKLCGYETCPLAAIPLIKSNRPDLVLLDIEMPGIDGFGILESIRGDGYSPEVIFVTGYDRYAIKAIRERAFDYLLKPVDRDELELAISRFRETLLRTDPESCLMNLSGREREVFNLLRLGHTSREISEKLNISKNTVDTHRRKILAKLDLDSTTQIYLNFPRVK